MKSISENLMELKKEYNDTYVNIAHSLRVHPTTISNYYRGKTIPSADTIKRIAAYYNVPVSRIDESSNKNRLLNQLGYDDVDQPSVEMTRVGRVTLLLETYRKSANLTVAGLAVKLSDSDAKLYSKLNTEYTRLLLHKELPSDEFFELVDEKLNITRSTLDICYVNGAEIDVASVIKYNLMSIMSQTNITSSDVDRALQHLDGTFDELVTHSDDIPPFDYLLDIADLFDIDIDQIDPFTEASICAFLNIDRY